MSVSRAEYDALKRVREAMLAERDRQLASGQIDNANAMHYALDVLDGLDEPPTEETKENEAHLRPEDLACRHDDGPRRWTLPFCDGCGKLGRRTLDSPACDCGALTYSEAQVVDRCHLSRAERERDEARAGAGGSGIDGGPT